MITTTEQAKELFDYRDGHLYWKVNPATWVTIGSQAGTLDHRGYITITLKGKKYNAHRLVWLWHGLELPSQIDHINGIKNDNRVENLRPADNETNMMNSKLKADNKSGVRGVSWCNTYKKWTVQLFCKSKKLTKRFKDFAEAKEFAETKRRELHGEFFSDRGLA